MKTLLLLTAAVLFAQGNQAGGRDMDQIRGEIDSVKEVILQDYELLLEETPDLAGELSVSFSITPEGQVIDAVVMCSEGLEVMEAAVLEQLNELTFPEAPDQIEDVPVSVPFTLVPGQS